MTRNAYRCLLPWPLIAEPHRKGRILPLCLMLLSVVCVSTFAYADDASSNQSPSPVTAAAAALPNAVTVAAVQQGVLTCSQRINQIANFIGMDERAGALLISPPSQPDQRLFALAAELPKRLPGSAAYVSATFSPTPVNTCGASYDAVVYWPQGCGDLAQQIFASFRPIGTLKTDVQVLDGGPTIKVFLMPAGSGCVSIRRELVY